MYCFFHKLSRWMAYLGGAMLCALILLTCISVVGRSLGGVLHSDGAEALIPGLATWLLDLGIGPVNGDFELIEAGVAFSIFAFLPLCQITGGHASVDVFARHFSSSVNRILRALTEAIFAAVLILIAVQLASGMLSKMNSGQTTLLIQFPIWWAYALSLTGAVIAAAVAIYLAIMRVTEFVTGRDILPQTRGAEN